MSIELGSVLCWLLAGQSQDQELLGDFNARVGSRVNQDDDWWYERGPHGHGVLNEAG